MTKRGAVRVSHTPVFEKLNGRLERNANLLSLPFFFQRIYRAKNERIFCASEGSSGRDANGPTSLRRVTPAS